MAKQRWDKLRALLSDALSPYTGQVAYGNLRIQFYANESDAEGAAEGAGRIAMAYETPGGSTNQLGISFEHGSFHMLDAAAEEELQLKDTDEVVAAVRRHVEEIPSYRMERLRQDIDRIFSDGGSRRDVLLELSRLMRLGTEFRGGSLTIEEFTDACRYVAARDNGSGG